MLHEMSDRPIMHRVIYIISPDHTMTKDVVKDHWDWRRIQEDWDKTGGVAWVYESDLVEHLLKR